jgi:hypothetical protein
MPDLHLYIFFVAIRCKASSPMFTFRLTNQKSKQENNHQQSVPIKLCQWIQIWATSFQLKPQKLIHLSTIYATVNSLQAVFSSGSRKQLT